MDSLGALSQSEVTSRRLLNRTTQEAERSIGKLASGRVVNRAADDVARLAIGAKLASTAASLRTVTTNIARGASQAQAASAGIATIQSKLVQALTLAVRSSSPNLSGRERSLLNVAFQDFLEEIDRTAKDARLGGIDLLNTAFAPIFISGDFDDGSLPPDTFLRASGSASVGAENKRLRLLDGADGNAVGALVNNTAFLTEGGLQARFTLTTAGPISGGRNLFGGGMSFFLVDADRFDAAASPLGGVSSSNLGYRQLAGGFLGVGFDSFGDYLQPEFRRETDIVAVRGPDSLGYPLLGNSFVNLTPHGGLDGPGDAPPQPLLERGLELSISDEFVIDLTISFAETGQKVDVLKHFDLGSLLPAQARPESVKFGFAATVGRRKNNFLIDDLEMLAGIDVGKRMAAAAKTLRATEDIDPNKQLHLPLYNATLKGLTLQNVSIETLSRAESAIRRLEFALGQSTQARAVLGGSISVFEKAANNLQVRIDNIEAARSSVQDLDVAREISKAVARQTARQAGISVLSQTNQAKRTFAAIFRSMIGNSALPVDTSVEI